MPDNLLSHLDDIKNTLNLFFEKFSKLPNHRVHLDNRFNKLSSVISSFFEDMAVCGERLNLNIKESVKINREIQNSDNFKYGNTIDEDGQKLRRLSNQVDRYNITDLKGLYIFAKIFLDQFIDILILSLDIEKRGVKFRNQYGNPSISKLFDFLDKYDGNEPNLIEFKEACLKSLNDVDVFITNYRDAHIVHAGLNNITQQWFMNNMDGNIYIGTSKVSVSPDKLLQVVKNCIVETLNFAMKKI